MDEIDCFRAALKHYVKERGGQSNVALDSHLSEGYISQIVNAKRKNPSRRTLTNIAAALKTTYRDMIALGEGILRGDSHPSAPPVQPKSATIDDDWKLRALIGSLRNEIDALSDKIRVFEESFVRSKNSLNVHEVQLAEHERWLLEIIDSCARCANTGQLAELKRLERLRDAG